eukprot:9344660-Pyramimonas_sp.AAC.1
MCIRDSGDAVLMSVGLSPSHLCARACPVLGVLRAGTSPAWLRDLPRSPFIFGPVGPLPYQ